MPLHQPFDLGTVYSKTGAQGLTTTPTFGAFVVADRASKIRLEVTVTLAGGSAAGNVTITAQSSRDGTNPDAMQIVTDATGAAAATGTVTTTAGATVRASFSIDPSGYKGGIRIGANTAGAVNAADVVTVVAEAA